MSTPTEEEIAELLEAVYVLSSEVTGLRVWKWVYFFGGIFVGTYGGFLLRGSV